MPSVFNLLIKNRIGRETVIFRFARERGDYGADGRRLDVLSGPISASYFIAGAANPGLARRRCRWLSIFIDPLDSEPRKDVFKDLAVWQREDVQLAVEKGIRLCCKAMEPEPVGNLGGRRCSIVLC